MVLFAQIYYIDRKSNSAKSSECVNCYLSECSFYQLELYSHWRVHWAFLFGLGGMVIHVFPKNIHGMEQIAILTRLAANGLSMDCTVSILFLKFIFIHFSLRFIWTRYCLLLNPSCYSFISLVTFSVPYSTQNNETFN